MWLEKEQHKNGKGNTKMPPQKKMMTTAGLEPATFWCR
jgi:hypothetical protein